ncbi:MAG TPA: alpha-glucosidase/alpha-galactosidase [Phototrophicaceae bacterium]|jgi:alpha-galactosidase|nr:alpha-glucosidase/alpha-galactosidase [Phototrophicaceae bacterium]
MALKIAMIGAGSVGFTRRLTQDILSVPELQDAQFTLMDISERNLNMVTQLVRREVEANHLPATINATTNRREAIQDADYVVCMIRQGGLDAFALDINIPLKYGVDQCVGDTICAGGIMYAQRTIPELLSICQDIREVAKPDALFLNYSNPMAMNTWACNKYGQVKTIGLCHGIQHGHHQIADCIQLWARETGKIGADETVTMKDVDIVCAGINHQTWYIKVQWRGMDMTPHLLEMFEAHPEFRQTEKVRIDVLKRFGYYSTESNGHLSEYVPWYRKHVDQIPQWIDLSVWINGETGGYLRVCTEGRNWFESDFPNWLKQEPTQYTYDTRSQEHGSYIIESLETGRIYRGHFNIINQGHITNLPNGCVIEIPGYVDHNGINMPVVGDLPLACAATCSASVRVQEMGMEAAVHGDVTLLKQAMLHDPLVGAVCNPEEVWQMTDELLVAQAEWLPNYATSEIEAARRRLSQAESNGTRVKLRDTEGAARLHTRTVEEQAQDRAAATANAGTQAK